jgi:polyphosphate kinase
MEAPARIRPVTIGEAPPPLEAPFELPEGETAFFNREQSWIAFNRRVLEEASDPRNPLLERVKFLAIFATNLDEFFMTRVSGVKEQLAAGVQKHSPDGLTPSEQLAAIRHHLLPLLEEERRLLREDLMPQLDAEGIHVLNYEELTASQRTCMTAYFERQVFPVLTPLDFDPSHPFPFISNLSLNLAVFVRDPEEGTLFARVKVPEVLPRLIPIPPEALDGANGAAPSRRACFVWIEQVIAANLQSLFPGVEVLSAYPFRVTRNADMEIEEDEADDLLRTIEQSVLQRRFGAVVRLAVHKDLPAQVRELLLEHLKLTADDVYTLDGPLGLSSLMALYSLDRPDLKDPPFVPGLPAPLRNQPDIFAAIRAGDILLHHPYDSFAPIVDMLNAAATDPDVLAIKQTLYRVGRNSPIVNALMHAREQGKQVTVLVELKARFDEENNITWARALERAGVHVVYGLIGLKTHAKIALFVRNESDGIRRYMHLGTGNYNASTARTYTDMGLLTCRPDIGADVSELFNFLTGYSRQRSYRKLLVAPVAMREQMLELIEREMAVHLGQGGGHLIFKMNQLVDPQMITELYRASQIGVRVDLIVRGICALRPSVPGMSENISVRSIVGRFLEHSRIYYFHNGGAEEMYLGSADLMERNLDRRVEAMFPVEDPALLRHLRDDLLEAYLRDNVRVRILQPDGTYSRLKPPPGEPVVDSQAFIPA